MYKVLTMVTHPAYLELAHDSVWTSFPYRNRVAKKDWANREISHANRFLGRAVEGFESGLVGVVYRLSRLAHFHARRGMSYSDLETEVVDLTDEMACELWSKAIEEAKIADADFLRQFPRNPDPSQWNEHREHEKRLYHGWEYIMDGGIDAILAEGEESDREPWASDSESWKPDGWQMSPNSDYNED